VILILFSDCTNSYQKLGLMGDLSMRDSGGKEKSYKTQSAAIPETTAKAKKQLQGMARVQRDAEGNIISVEETGHSREDTAWGPVLNSDDEEEEEVEGGVAEIIEDEEAADNETDVTKCESLSYILLNKDC
jgi:hypothetical protein